MNRKLLFATVVSALGSFLFGFDTAVISGTTKFITGYFQLTDASLGMTVSIALWGTVVGAIAVGKPGDILGRKKLLSICGALYFFSALGCAVATGWYTLLVFRFIGGLAIGAASVMAPMYIAEISPGRLRGRLVAVAQFNIVLGILVAFFSNYLLVGVGPNNWRWMFGVMAIPAAFFFILLFFVPESPRWLVKKSRVTEAQSVLEKVGAENVGNEISEIVNSLKEEAGQGAAKLLQKKYGFVIMCAMLLAVFNQLSGINVIMYYAPMIFEKAGASTNAAMLEAVAVGVTNMIFTIIAMFFIDKFGRKTLLLIGAVGMFFSLAGAALHYYDETLFGSTGVVVFIVGFIAFFAFSQGAVIWVFLAEIFPNKVRSKGQALGSFTHWIMNAIIGLLFPIALAGFGGGDVFMFFAVMMIPFFFFVWKVMPETKGKSLEELERIVVSQ
ncbi:MAG TPA: sugar porter family MFS transporter [Candidatus Kryptobacter bacterium]|nr:MAG: MFS transporter [Ignavibacteriae bacterium 37-53-5]HQT91866.1 sugar porter family MFS transporter [Candidatus Kryptobacter bacterium]